MIKISKRISEIVAEATGNNTISRITSDEREEIGRIFENLTGSKIDSWCNVCIIQACYLIKNNNPIVGEIKKNTKTK